MTPDEIAALLEHAWGLRGTLTRLGGESHNVRVDTPDGRRFVLKVLEPGEPDAHAGLEAAVAERVARTVRDIRLPRAVPTVSGEILARTGGLRARLLEWVDGTSWIDAPDPGTERLVHLGETLARVALALEGFTHVAANRTHAWDLTRAGDVAHGVARIRDDETRDRVERAFLLWRAIVRPRLASLPHAIIHGDANDENVLVDGDRVVGLLDFGDALHNPRVCELAICLTYALLGADDPLAAGAHVVGGWHSVLPLRADELAVLFPLVCARLAVSLTIAAGRRDVAPERAAWYVSEIPARELLARIIDVPPIEGARALAARTAVDPHPDEPVVSPRDVLERRRVRIGPSLSIAYREPVFMARGEGQYLFDDGGRPYLDLVNNVCHVGHCHPRVVAAGQAQMARLNTNTRYLHDAIVAYADRLVATLPEPLRVCWFVNSGSEANELALRLACTHTGRRDVLVVDAAYHGNTDQLTALSPYKFMGRGGSGRAESWVHVTPLPDGYRGMRRGFTREAGIAYGEEVGRAIALSGKPVAAFIAESLPSCGGQIVPPPGWLETAFTHVRAAGGVCIIDEVQTGFGRVGSRFWGFELQDVVPDIVVLGKPIANGHPMGAVVTSPEIAASFANGMEFFSTFGGNPVSCAIANAVLDVIQEDHLQQRAADLGARFLAGLSSLVERHRAAGHARGTGLFLGLELVRDTDTREPAPATAAAVVERMKQRGVLLSTDGPDQNVIKIKPPMVIDAADVDMTLRMLDEVLADVSAGIV